jgi:hypothetical protein
MKCLFRDPKISAWNKFKYHNIAAFFPFAQETNQEVSILGKAQLRHLNAVQRDALQGIWPLLNLSRGRAQYASRADSFSNAQHNYIERA